MTRPSFRLTSEFVLSTKFNPRKSVSVYNPYPQSKWPFRFGTWVWAVTSTADVVEGRVEWYHPARPVDHSCCITPGKPIIGIKVPLDLKGKLLEGILVTAENVFAHNLTGFRQANHRRYDMACKSRVHWDNMAAEAKKAADERFEHFLEVSDHTSEMLEQYRKHRYQEHV